MLRLRKRKNSSPAVKPEKAKEKNNPFDLVIVDLMMPGMNGQELGQTIRNDPKLKCTKMIMLTILGHKGNNNNLPSNELTEFITKPVKPSMLFNSILSLLDTSKQKSAIRKPAKHPKTNEVETSIKPLREKMRVLLAEDNVINQKVAIRIINKLGYDVDVVNNGQEAIEALKTTTTYNAILIDCQMPEMDGYEATKVIRKMNGFDKNFPIIAMTAGAMESDKIACFDEGMDDYLTKPINQAILGKTLDKWLGISEVSRE